MSEAVFVLGMHRSGTSAMARVGNLLGVWLGNQLLPGARDNEKGYFEDAAIVDIHARLLAQVGLAWNSLCEPPTSWQDLPESDALRGELRQRIDELSAGQRCWGVKDPRMGRLLPLWRELLGEATKPRCLIMVRSPLDVAASLAKRNGFEPMLSYWLWFLHLRDIERQTRDLPRVFIQYDELLAAPGEVIAAIEQQLQWRFPSSYSSAAAEIEAFLSPELRHHSTGNTFDLQSVPAPVQELYRLLTTAPVLQPAQASLDAVFSEVTRDLQPWDAALRLANRELAAARTAIQTLSGQVDHWCALTGFRERDLAELTTAHQKLVEEAATITRQRDETLALKVLREEELTDCLQRVLALQAEAELIARQRDETHALKVQREGELADWQLRHGLLELEKNELIGRLDAVAGELSAVYSSIFWRMTSPLRALAEWWRTHIGS